MNTKWIEINDTAAHDRALELARGCYQRDLLEGHENLSGSTLKGKAGLYASRYARSRENLLARLRSAGIPVCERRGEHGRRILVIG